MKEDAPQRKHSPRELFNGLRWFVRAGCPWRMMPNDLPPWHAVQRQTFRWVQAECFQTMAKDLRTQLRVLAQRSDAPSVIIGDSRTIQSTPESGGRGGYDGIKKRKGSMVPVAVDTLGQLLALKVTTASEQDREQVGTLAQVVQAATGKNVRLAYVDQGYTGERASEAAQEHEIRLEVVKLKGPKQGFVFLPRRWVVGIVWMGRSVSAARRRLRTTRHHPGRLPLARFRSAHAQTLHRQKYMTGSSAV